jgi:hypothetical protein
MNANWFVNKLLCEHMQILPAINNERSLKHKVVKSFIFMEYYII